jgi:hypothetical protein
LADGSTPHGSRREFGGRGFGDGDVVGFGEAAHSDRADHVAVDDEWDAATPANLAIVTTGVRPRM